MTVVAVQPSQRLSQTSGLLQGADKSRAKAKDMRKRPKSRKLPDEKYFRFIW